MAAVPKPPTEWYHRRFQAVGRAQARYFLLSLLLAAYTFGLSFTTGDSVSVSILGLPDIPKTLVNAAALIVLGVVLLALFGTLQAAREAFAELEVRLKDDEVTSVAWHLVDEHPNVADFLSYATYVDAKPQPWARGLALVLYPIPVLAMVAWTVTLWARGVSACTLEPSWLTWVYRVGVVLVLAVLGGAAVFVRRRWELFRTGK